MTTIASIIPSTQPIAGEYWQWRQEKIYYVRSGEPKDSQTPPLLLIHGFGASTDHWRKNIAELSRDFQVFAIDLLGFGRSAKPAWEYSADLWQQQIHDFISEVIGAPVVLGGNSLGGYVALCVAANHPESAEGLVLLNSAGPFTDSTHPREPNQLQKVINSLATGILRHPIGNFLLFKFVQRKSFIRNTLKKVYVNQQEITDQLVEEIYRPSIDPGAVDVFGSIFSNPQGEKVDILLGRMHCPLLMIWGEGDPWINAKNRGAKFREYYPSLVEHYLNSGHCPHDDSPAEVNAIVGDWMKSGVFSD